MRAIFVERHGPPEVLRLREAPAAPPGPGQAAVRVAAVGINFADLLARMGLYPGAPKPPFIPGLELAGTVEALGQAVAGSAAAPEQQSLRTGDRVAALVPHGAYAERVVVPQSRLIPLPGGIPFNDAAAIPVNYLTAYHSMFEMGNLRAGDRILIHGAAGGVGVAAVQLARARGLYVFGTAGAAKQEFLRQSGVDRPIDYTREDFVAVVRAQVPEGIEMVMDPIGGRSFARSYRCLGPMGRLVVYGFSAAAGPAGRRSLWRGARALWQTPRFHPLKLMSRNVAVIGVHLGRLEGRGRVLQRELEELFRLYAAGQIKPVIGRAFPLAEAAAAHRYIHARKNMGKVVLLAE